MNMCDLSVQPVGPGSVTLWISGLKEGNAEAVEKIWGRYFTSLRDAARKRFNGFPTRAADEEDVAVSVFDTLCRGAKRGRFPQLADRDELWGLLLVIVSQKVNDRKRLEGRLKRGSARVRGDSVWGSLTASRGPVLREIVSQDPTPELLTELEDERAFLFSLLRSDGLRRIAGAKLEGYSNMEIADRLGVSVRTVQRKVRLIHERWASVLVGRP
jgi:DNA-directed RNA polymerase specialized sigma24 family protein